MSDDLISRRALMESLRGNVLVDVTTDLEQAIAEQPTAYDVDKVVEQMERERKITEHYHKIHLDDVSYGKMMAYDRAINYIKSGGIEWNR